MNPYTQGMPDELVQDENVEGDRRARLDQRKGSSLTGKLCHVNLDWNLNGLEVDLGCPILLVCPLW